MKPADNAGPRRGTPSGDDDDSNMPLLVSRVPERFVMGEQAPKHYTRPYSYYDSRGGWVSPNPASTREENHLCNIDRPVTAGTTLKHHHIQHTTCITSLQMIPIDVAYEMITFTQRMRMAVGQKRIHQKTHGIHHQHGSGPNAIHLPHTTQSTPGLIPQIGPPDIYHGREGLIGGRRGRAGTETMDGTRVGERMTHGSQGKATPADSTMTGSARTFKPIVLNAIRMTGCGSLLHPGSRREAAVVAVVEAAAVEAAEAAEGIRANAIKATDATKIGTGMVKVVERAASTFSKSGISGRTIAISTSRPTLSIL
ncbi:hypothetical protein BC834DRAFT_685466 [Gloeopeniophorella convolvens]|nr:hypothetical protein BC834DRAFT_685466 [Gloeopeniophorella convolvens]